MNEAELERLANERAASASYKLELYFSAGNLTPDQRRSLAKVMQRVCTGLATQLKMIIGENSNIELFYDSSTAANVQLDIE